MKLRPQPNHNEVSATPTTSALNAHKVVDELYILHILCNDVMYTDHTGYFKLYVAI